MLLHHQCLQALYKLLVWLCFVPTAVFRLVVQKLRRESAHARPFGGDFELKILRMREFSSRFLDNQPENCCICSIVFMDVGKPMHMCSGTILKEKSNSYRNFPPYLVVWGSLRLAPRVYF